MAKIIFFVWPNIGSQVSSMKLATDLKNNGHTITYMGLDDSSDYIRSHGFEFIPLFQNHFPKGFLSEQKKFAALSWSMNFFSSLKEGANNFNSFFDDLLNGSAGEQFLENLKNTKPDLIIYSSGVPSIEWMALLAYSLDIKGVYFHDMLIPCRDTGVPPGTSLIIPNASLKSRISIYFSWIGYNLTFSCYKAIRYAYLILSGVRLNDITKDIANKLNYHGEIHKSPYKRHRLFMLPELVSFPSFFDFPGAEIPGRYYIGASLFTERKEADFSWDNINNERPIIYCALGAVLPYRKREAIKLFNTILKSSDVRPDWHWVIATGDNISDDDLDRIPPNITIVRNAPQMAILKRAALMITHGGANTVKESMYFGVPMIIITDIESPVALTEIPSYTSRAVRLGLGVSISLKKLSENTLRTLINAVDKDPYIRGQTRIIQAECKRIENENSGLKIIETLLQ